MWFLAVRVPILLLVFPLSLIWHFGIKPGWEMGSEGADALKEWADNWVKRQNGDD